LRGLSAVTPMENSDTATVASTIGMRAGVAHDDVGGHRVAEQRQASPVHPGQGPGERHHAVERVQQRAGARVLVGEAAGHRGGVPAVAGEVEGDGDVAVAGEGDRERLHQLLRAGEAVGDHGQRGRRCGGVGWRGPVHRDRNRARGRPGNVQAGGGARELPEPDRDRDDRGDGNR
jgi:hypothetical protein